MKGGDKKTFIGRKGLENLEGVKGAKVKVKCDKDVNVLKVTVKGQPVFVCCKGCEAEAKAHPDETLLQFQQLMKRVSQRK